jgi:hypothetical protein
MNHPMNIAHLRLRHDLAIVLLSAAAALVAGCGGGGNESGDPDRITVEPGELSVSGPSGACGRGVGPEVHVWGGQPPYKLTNSVPVAMVLSDTRLDNSGDGFTIEFLGGCLDHMPITIEDDMGRLATLLVSNVPGE